MILINKREAELEESKKEMFARVDFHVEMIEMKITRAIVEGKRKCVTGMNLDAWPSIKVLRVNLIGNLFP